MRFQSMYAPQKPAPTSTTAQSAGEQIATLPAGAGAGRGVINPDSVNPAAPPPQSQAAMAMQSIGDVKREGNELLWYQRVWRHHHQWPGAAQRWTGQH